MVAAASPVSTQSNLPRSVLVARMEAAYDRHWRHSVVNQEILGRFRYQVQVLESIEFELKAVLEHRRLSAVQPKSL